MEEKLSSSRFLAFHELSLEERLTRVKNLSPEEQWAQGLLLGDEWANSLTHGIGLVLSLIGLILLILTPFQEGNHWKLLNFAVYGVSLVLLYAASTLYHAVRRPALKRLLRTVDHCAIYLLIAGSYTPFTMLLLQGVWGWTLFGIIWSLAFLGIIFKIFFIHRFQILSTSIYLLMGWLVVIAAEPFIDRFHYAGLCWVVAGGLCYTFGVIFYAFDKRRFYHAIWHLFVLSGSICHYFAILFYL
jgi:hemolysin III